jgi:hypothetical protein
VAGRDVLSWCTNRCATFCGALSSALFMGVQVPLSLERGATNPTGGVAPRRSEKLAVWRNLYGHEAERRRQTRRTYSRKVQGIRRAGCPMRGEGASQCRNPEGLRSSTGP